jgi:hypothetical protein
MPLARTAVAVVEVDAASDAHRTRGRVVTGMPPVALVKENDPRRGEGRVRSRGVRVYADDDPDSPSQRVVVVMIVVMPNAAIGRRYHG